MNRVTFELHSDGWREYIQEELGDGTNQIGRPLSLSWGDRFLS